MNPIVVSCIYGTALWGAICLGAVYTYWSHKQDKKNPPPPVKISDTGDEKRLISAIKHIKVVCRN